MSTFTGIFIENHKTLDADSKAYATQNLTDWQTESCTPADWVAKLELRTDNSTLRFFTTT